MAEPTLTVELDLVGVGWTAVPIAEVKSIEIERGAAVSADHRLPVYDTGRATVVLKSPAAKWNPFNTAGPLYGQLRHGQRIRIRGTGSGSAVGGDYLFSGRVDQFADVILQGDRALGAELTCYDPLADAAGVDLAELSAPIAAGEEVSARLSRVATAAGWSGLGWSTSFTAGSTTLAATVYGVKALNEMRAAVQADGGHLWCDPDGTLCYEPRNSVATLSRGRTVQATFGAGSGEVPFSSGYPAADRRLIVSAVRLARDGAAAVEVSGAATYGPQVFKADKVAAADDFVLLGLTRSIFDRYSAPVATVPEIVVVGTSSSYPHILRRRIRDLVRVRYSYPAAIDVDAWVTGVRIDIVEKGPWVATFRLAPAGVWATRTYFNVGTSVVGGSDFVLW